MSDTKADEVRSESEAPGTPEVKVRPLVVFVAGLTVAIVAACLILLGILRLFNARESAKDATAKPVTVQRSAIPPAQRPPAQPVGSGPELGARPSES